MGLWGKLIATLTGGTNSPLPPVPASAPERLAGGVTITITGPAGPLVEVSDAEVAERASAYAFVLVTDPSVLKTGAEWWNEETHRRRKREGSEKAYAWLLPFMPLEIAKLAPLQAAQEWGPHSANAIAGELRAIIRAKRKAKESHQSLLQALYGVCVAADLANSVAFEGRQSHHMVRFVDINEFQTVKIDYEVMGYQCIQSLKKTDVKWLVEAFGEPAEHQSFDALWPTVRRNAIARYCWMELRSNNSACKSLGMPEQSMQEWLNELVKRNIGYRREGQERGAAREAYLAESETACDAAWTATRQPFVVADLETTGLNADTDEVIEFAAVRVSPEGAVIGEFATLVRVTLVPLQIARLTGITQTLVEREGLPLPAAMKAFAEFVGSQPLFFHNAPFDQRFLKKAAEQTQIKLGNPVHDTLPLARQAWPSLETYKLSALAEHVGTAIPTHRGLSDAKAALAVLLAARDIADPTQRVPRALADQQSPVTFG